MDVSCNSAETSILEDSESSDGSILTDVSDSFLLEELNCLGRIACKRLCHEFFNRSRLLLDDVINYCIAEALEVVCVCSEVCLNVDLNKDTALLIVSDLSDNSTLGSNSGRLLLSLSHTLFTEPALSLLDVAVALDKSLLAVHNAAICQITKFFNLLCTNSHVCISFYEL